MPRGHSMDLTGQRYGRLVVQSLHTMEKGRSVWKCLCDCGNKAIVKAGNLRRNSTKSCGCYRRENSAKQARTHGMTRSPTYLTWVSMLQRCENPEATSYEFYGAIGIKVCEAWHTFESFLEDMGERPKGRTLDRKNPYGHYEPSNCRWATSKEQGENKRGSM